MGSFDFTVKKPGATNHMKMIIKCSNDKLTFISAYGNKTNFGQVCIFLVRFLLDNLKTFCQNRDLKCVYKYEQSQSNNCQCDFATPRSVPEKCSTCQRMSCRTCYNQESQVCKGHCKSFMVFIQNNRSGSRNDDLLIEPSTNSSPFYNELTILLTKVTILTIQMTTLVTSNHIEACSLFLITQPNTWLATHYTKAAPCAFHSCDDCDKSCRQECHE